MEKILLTGATGYIGKRMISVIAAQGYKVVCCRDVNRFEMVWILMMISLKLLRLTF
jgi:nucleoside-diphosphate-sugar epimerase